MWRWKKRQTQSYQLSDVFSTHRPEFIPKMRCHDYKANGSSLHVARHIWCAVASCFIIIVERWYCHLLDQHINEYVKRNQTQPELIMKLHCSWWLGYALFQNYFRRWNLLEKYQIIHQNENRFVLFEWMSHQTPSFICLISFQLISYTRKYHFFVKISIRNSSIYIRCKIRAYFLSQCHLLFVYLI